MNLRDSRDGAKRLPRALPRHVPERRGPRRATIYNAYRLLGQPATAFYDARGERTYIHQGPYDSVEAFDADIRRYALGSSS